jgi:two-component system sensor histidine kinase MprB
MSLRIRLTLIIGAVAAAVLAAIAWAAYASARDEARGEIDAFLQDRALVVSSLREMEGGMRGMFMMEGPRPGGPRGPAGLVRDDVVVQAVTTESVIVLAPSTEPVLPVDDTDLAVAGGTSDAVLRDVDHNGVPYRMLTTPGPEGMAVQLARDLTETEAFLGDLRTRLVLTGLAGVAAIAVVAWFVARRALTPVARLTGAAEHVAATTDLDTPIEVGGNDEIGRLGTAFNSMLAALGTSRRQQERLIADAGHELRTPLTSLRTNIEVLAARAAEMDEADRAEILADAAYELEQMTALVGELVDLAGDGGTDRSDSEVRLDELVRETAERSARRTGRRVEVEASPTTVLGNADDLRRAVANLLDNAHKWSPPDVPVEVEVAGGRVTVMDRGPGIAEEDRDLVFERFYRAADARTRPGSGLGLAIVRQIAERHGGRVWAAAREGGGAAVGFEIPTAG